MQHSTIQKICRFTSSFHREGKIYSCFTHQIFATAVKKDLKPESNSIETHGVKDFTVYYLDMRYFIGM